MHEFEKALHVVSWKMKASKMRLRGSTCTTVPESTKGTTREMAAQPATLLTRKEVAVLAKVCTHTIARDVRAGSLAEIRFNRRRIRYHPNAVRAYLSGDYRDL